MRNARRFAGIVMISGLLAWAAVPAAAQSYLPRHLVGVTLGGLFPNGEFNDHVRQEGLGGSCFFAWRLGRSPLLVGLEINAADYGHSRRYEYLPGIPDVGVPVDTTNSIVQSLLLFRLQPRSGRLTSFFEALGGGSYLWTDTTIGNHDADEEPMASDTNFDDYTWTAGAGAGLSYQFWKPADPQYVRRGTFLELKVRYLAGGRADYLRKGSIVVIGDEYTFIPERSSTGLITVQVGLTWLF